MSDTREMIGVDEVGRGAWAGPVVVGIVRGSREKLGSILSQPTPSTHSHRLDHSSPSYFDSKALSQKRRGAFAHLIHEAAKEVALGCVQPSYIDEFGMTRALRQAFINGTEGMDIEGEEVLLDGKHNYLEPVLPNKVVCIVKGDTRDPLIAAASIVAKVYRDKIMANLAESFPYYGFETNVGYPSRIHKWGLQGWGPSSIHRVSWSYIQNLIYSTGRTGGIDLGDKEAIFEVSKDSKKMRLFDA